MKTSKRGRGRSAVEKFIGKLPDGISAELSRVAIDALRRRLDR